MKAKIYLAGPIDHCTFDEIHGWRNYIRDEWGCDFNLVDPCRRMGKNLTAREIVTMDKVDIAHCDCLLANYWKNGTGTAMEMPYAFEKGKLVVVIVPNLKAVSPWITFHSHYVTDDLDVAMDWVTSYYNGLHKVNRKSLEDVGDFEDHIRNC